MRGQASIDQLIASGVSLLAIAALLALSFVFFSSSSEISTAKSAVSTLSRAVDFVDATGYGTNITVQVRLPSNIQTFTAAGSTLNMLIATPGGQSNIFENTLSNISGNLPNSTGIHLISVAALANGTVVLQEKSS